MRRLRCLLVAAGLAVTAPVTPIAQSPATFIGTTPCGDIVRAFVGGMPAGATCHAIRWALALGTPDANRWRLTAEYGVPPAANPNAMIDGPRVTKQGTLTSSTVQRLGAASTLYRLTADAGTSIAFAQVGNPGPARLVTGRAVCLNGGIHRTAAALFPIVDGDRTEHHRRGPSQ